MPDLKKYWQEIRAIEKTLPDFVWIMSLDNPKRGQVGGSLAETSAGVAAKLLQAKSHRLAKEEEVAFHRQREAQLLRSNVEQKLRRQGVAVVSL